MPTEAVARKRRRRDDDVLAAAVKVFHRRGYSEATIQDIADVCSRFALRGVVGQAAG
jgi:AcrR family transcriptional regulator